MYTSVFIEIRTKQVILLAHEGRHTRLYTYNIYTFYDKNQENNNVAHAQK